MRPCRSLVPIVVVVLAGCASMPPATSDERPRELIGRVFDAFNRCDIPVLVSQYSDRSLVFFTSNTPQPLTSRADLTKYFSYLTEEPCSSPQSLKHTNVTSIVRPLAAGAAIVHTTTVVQAVYDGKPISIPFRFTFVVQDAGDGWFVISQDAQRVPAAK